MSPEAIDALVAAGVSAEQLAVAIKAEMAAAQAVKASRRTKDAARKRASRAKLNDDNVRDVTRTDADRRGQTVTSADRPSPEVPPKDITQTPLLPPSGSEKGARAVRSLDWPKDGFRQFYDRYPRKKAPADAEKAWRKVERIAGLTFAAVMAGLERLIESDPDPNFIPYPATWLNSGQYANEPDPPPRQSTTRRQSHGQALNDAFDDLGRHFRDFDDRPSGGPLLPYRGH